LGPGAYDIQNNFAKKSPGRPPRDAATKKFGFNSGINRWDKV
jgi:hypothetical protein